MAGGSTSARGAPSQTRGISPTIVIVGQIDEVFQTLQGNLARQAVRVEHVPAKELSDRLAQPERPLHPWGNRPLYLFNLSTVAGVRYDWRTLVKRVSECEPDARIVLAFDKPTGATIEAAVEAGADDLLYRAELRAFVLVWKRLRELLGRFEEYLPRQQLEISERKALPPSANEKRAALARVEQAIIDLPTRAVRREPLAGVFGISAPDLRAPSGRLDATKIAERLDVPVARLAGALDVSRQAVSQTPDSVNLQSALDPMARIIDVLDHVLSRGDQLKWLQSPHSRLKGATPIDAILNGRAESVARMLESTRGGGVD